MTPASTPSRSLRLVATSVIVAANWLNQAHGFDALWTRQFGSPVAESQSNVATLNAGGVYLTGATASSLDGATLGDFDVYVRRYNSEGSVVWARQLGSTRQDLPFGIGADAADNVYVTGRTNGNFAAPRIGPSDVFLFKMDSNGTLQWSRQLGGADSAGVAVDAMGNSYVVGWAETLGGPSLGGLDAYITKFDSAGINLWVRRFGTSADDRPYAVAADHSGNIYVAGSTTGNLAAPNAGGGDAFIRKYDPSGATIWTRQFGGDGFEEIQQAAVDATGNLYVAGRSLTAGVADLTLLLKFDPLGNQQWTRTVGANLGIISGGLTTTPDGDVFLSGSFARNVDVPSAPDRSDAFVTRYDASGSLLAMDIYGTTSIDHGGDIASDAEGNLYLAGITLGNLAGPNAGASDAFLRRSVVPEPSSTFMATAAAVTLANALRTTLSRRKTLRRLIAAPSLAYAACGSARYLSAGSI